MSIAVTVVYSAGSRDLTELVLKLMEGSTVAVALQASGVLTGDLGSGRLPAGQGVWGRQVPLSHVLRDLDRLEVYRALTVDPKVARRQRFVRQGAKKAAGLFAKKRVGAKAGY